jgi:hypothetical protein
MLLIESCISAKTVVAATTNVTMPMMAVRVLLPLIEAIFYNLLNLNSGIITNELSDLTITFCLQFASCLHTRFITYMITINIGPIEKIV